MIRLRFALFRATLKTEALEKKNKIFFDGRSEEDLLDVDRELDEQLRILEKDMEFITECNSGGKPLATIELKSLKKIAEKKFTCDGR
jgi:hypothetical protein